MRARVLAVVVVVVAGCAVTSSTCPLGAKLVVTNAPAGRVEACATEDAALTKIPVPGVTAASDLSAQTPVAPVGGLDGPFTSWYPNGRLREHGQFVSEGSRALPDGLWAFWYPSGQRASLGAYYRGERVGCVIAWDENGQRETGHVIGGHLQVDGCVPPSDAFLAEIENRRAPEAPGRANMAITVAASAGSMGMGARNANQIDSDPRMLGEFSVDGRKRFGRWSAGPVFGLKLSLADYTAYEAGAVVGYEFARLGRLGAEVSVDARAQYTSLFAEHPARDGTAPLGFWMPVVGAQIATSLQVAPRLELVGAVRAEGAPRQSEQRDVTYCVFGCFAPVSETWRVGGGGVEATFGLRLEVR